MDKFQAAFEILYLLALVDGRVDDSEIDQINGYINDNLGQGSYDSVALARQLTLLTPKGRIEEVVRAGAVIGRECGMEEKLHVLGFAYGVICADGKVTPEEAAVFVVLGGAWNIDVAKFVKSHR